MYKLLSIILFSIVLANPANYNKEIQDWIDWKIQDTDEEINATSGDRSDFYIKIEYEVLDTFYVDEIITNDIQEILITDEMEKRKAEFESITAFTDGKIKLEEIKDTPVYLLIKFRCNAFINKNNQDNKYIKRNLKSVIENDTDCQNKVDDSSFTFIEISPKNVINTSIAQFTNIIRDDIYNDSWAVIIGIDKYKYSKQLNYAVEDAESVRKMLIDKFDFPQDNIRYLINEEATLSEIKLALDDIATLAGENDRILVFYSGHGETIPTKDDSEKGYIIPYEGKLEKAYATGLAMDEVLTTSQLSNAKHMLFLMDACYSGLMTQQYKGLAKSTDKGYLTQVANESARQIITAGGKNQKVIERDVWRHSAFTKNLLEGLEDWEADYNNDGCITAEELSLYLRENVTEDSNGQQTPQDGRFINSGGGEFVFFNNIPRDDVSKPIVDVSSRLHKNIEIIMYKSPILAYGLSLLLTPLIGDIYAEGIKGATDGLFYTLSEVALGTIGIRELIISGDNIGGIIALLSIPVLRLYNSKSIHNKVVTNNKNLGIESSTLYYGIMPRFGTGETLYHTANNIGGAFELRWDKNFRWGVAMDFTDWGRDANYGNIYTYYEIAYKKFFPQVNLGFTWGDDPKRNWDDATVSTSRTEYGFIPTIGMGISREYKIGKNIYIKPGYYLHLGFLKTTNHLINIGVGGIF